MHNPARLRVTIPGLVLIDCDVPTLVLSLLLSHREHGAIIKNSIRFSESCPTIAIETVTVCGTQLDLIEPGEGEDID